MKHTRKIAAMASAAALALSMSGMTAFTEDTGSTSIQSMIASMTTEQKVEQMMMITLRPWSDGTEGAKPVAVTELNETQTAFIKRHNFGGVCLFAPNIQTTEQSIKLTDEIQQAALKSEQGIPMLIAADQEGGKIYRLQTGTPTCGNMALGATGDPSLAYQNAQILGSEVKALGINTNLAPVLDVNNNPSNPVINLRSFSSDPETVSKMGVQYIKGLQSEGVVTTVKHYPGHGDTATDSHTGLPLINKTYDELKQMELYPYTAAVEAGTDMVMTAHIQFPQVETGTYTSKSTGEQIGIPATLSKTIVTDILRGDYKYDGVVITDSMVMDAVAKNFDLIDSAVMAMNADVDIILEPMTIACPADIDKMESYITDVVQQVKDGKVSVSTIDKSVERILTMKQERGILNYEKPDAAKALQTVGSDKHREDALDVAEKAVTLVKNADNTLPLKLGETGKVAYFYGYENVGNTMTFALDRLKKEGVIAEGVTAECNCFKDHTAAEYEQVIKDSDAVILALEMYNTGSLTPSNASRGWQSAFADDLIALAHKLGKKVVYLSAHIPYDVARFQDADAIVAAYCANGMEELPVDGQENKAYGVNYPAALITILGGNTPNGKLPIDVYAFEENMKYTDQLVYPRGFGMTYEPAQYTDLGQIITEIYSPLAKNAYQATTGNKAAKASVTMESKTDKVIITLTDAAGAVLEVYTVTSTDGKGVNQKGETIDLTEYAPKTLTDDERFVPSDALHNVVRSYYLEQNGDTFIGGTSSMTVTDTDYVLVSLEDNDNNVIAKYMIDERTGIGSDTDGNPVNLGAYVKAHPDAAADPADMPDESGFFAPTQCISEYAKSEYIKKTGSVPSNVFYTLSANGSMMRIKIEDENSHVLDSYVIETKTGKGAVADLSAYASAPESKYYTSLENLSNMVKIDYEKKNGVASYVSKAELTEDGLSYRVQLTDADGNELMEYSVNPFTGYGETSFGNAVELPQTGVTSPRTAAAAAGALALTVSGLFAVLKSGFIRRKDQE